MPQKLAVGKFIMVKAGRLHPAAMRRKQNQNDECQSSEKNCPDFREWNGSVIRGERAERGEPQSGQKNSFGLCALVAQKRKRAASAPIRTQVLRSTKTWASITAKRAFSPECPVKA